MVLGHATVWDEIGAIATAAAVVVALATPWILEGIRHRREKKLRPSLSLVFDPRTDCVIEEVDYSDGKAGHAAWVRVGVRSERNRRTAEDVEVLLEKAEPLVSLDEVLAGYPAENAEPLPSVDEILIAYPAIPWTHVGGATRLTIPPGVTRYLDIATVYLRDDWERKLNLLIAAKPKDERNRVSPGAYRLLLVVSSRNAETRRYALDIEWDGEFGEHLEEIWDHLKVQQPQLA